jgi:RNA polymerase sigma factor (sigma-70 family)
MDYPAATITMAPEPISPDAFDRSLACLRPKLHRYCARMVGSAVDAEDVVQEALIKAVEAFREPNTIADVEAWLFRVAHNTALDFLRRQLRPRSLSGDEDITMIADPIDEVHQRQAAAAGLHTRNMLAEDVRLELVNKTRMRGSAEVGRYFSNYASVYDWRLQLGFVDRRAALIVSDRNDPAQQPMYFILLSWTAGQIGMIRDFRYARYVTEAAEIVLG